MDVEGSMRGASLIRQSEARNGSHWSAVVRLSYEMAAIEIRQELKNIVAMFFVEVAKI